MMVWAGRPMMRGAIEALLAESDSELARTGLESELKLLEGLLNLKPDDRQMLVLAAQGFAGYALMFLEDEEPARALVFYERARCYGLKALAGRDKGFVRDDLSFGEFYRLIGRLKPSDLPAAYWTALAWAGRINLERSSPKALAQFPRANALMEWVMGRDPHFYYSGPLWFFGTYYSSLPPMMGGDLERARDYFERAMKTDGDRFLFGKLLYARNYAVQAYDRELFEALLTEVIAGIADCPDDLRLMNSIAARKAAILMKRADEIF